MSSEIKMIEVFFLVLLLKISNNKINISRFFEEKLSEDPNRS